MMSSTSNSCYNGALSSSLLSYDSIRSLLDFANWEETNSFSLGGGFDKSELLFSCAEFAYN